MIKSSINKSEIEKFTKIADSWWDINGPFKMLHIINPVRLEYIKSQIGEDLKKIHILDLGCGGGILSFPLEKMGAKVSALDAGKENIEAAKLEAKKRKSKVDFIHSSIEDHKKSYDAIICLELLEHLDNPGEFIANIAKNLKKNGRIILSTLNRNPKSYMLAIGMAEYVLGWVDQGTHDYSKFIKPSELAKMLEANNIKVTDIAGMSYNVITRSWKLSKDIAVNYFITGVKE
jgi:2-polyprenyl-6-hydroxyphenyl methylase/3-demethylubiquinone-9 3-methyltransferase